MQTQSAPLSYNDLQDCIQNCMESHHVCVETATYCLQQGGEQAEAGHIRLLMDCAEICHTSADFMIRGSLFHHLTCAACAEICQRCAEECGLMSEDPQLMECVDACHQCAESCRQMASAMQM